MTLRAAIMVLIDDWRQCWRFWSIRLGALGSALTGFFIAWPEAALHAWALLPEELRAAIPPHLMPLIGVGVFVLAMVARLLKQSKLQKGKGQDDAGRD